MPAAMPCAGETVANESLRLEADTSKFSRVLEWLRNRQTIDKVV
jgi:hypothetical protein